MVIDTVTKTKGLERGEATNATQTNAEASINRALRIETATTRISDGLNRAIGQYHKMSAEIVRAEDGVRYQGLPAHVIGKAFIDINREIDNGKYTFYDFKGGRGSLKSSFCALKLIDRIMRNENMCALAIRQIAETIKDSVFAQIIWAIDILGLTEEFHITKSPMEIKRKSTGQVIYFRGGDNPYKIKSIRPPQGKYIGVLWLEEKDQLGGNEAVRSIYQSAIRGGDGAIVLASYNTPISKLHWINKDALVVNDRRTIHHSHFMDAPKDWLGQEFFDIAEHTKQVNLRAYQHEYDGIAVGSGYTVFENLKIEAIDDGIIRTFDRILNGVDFGWFPDPWAFVRCYLHKGSMTLYIFDESVGNKITNDRAVEIILGKGVGRSETVVCDSAEPKSIQDYMLSGLRRAVGAKKGPGSIDYSFKWLQGLNAIVIDPKRCPRAAQEFSAYEYERDKYGNVLSGYPDRDNHTIDAVRYATEAAWKRGGFVT
ncbi:MAG: PBSX family phage terminase large subunit [Clostridiales bacterium]|jgi:PBSX family phage terminase large subunit|nr:PBSX family phage terminase large subunit [Clostridiales bacterium]